MLKLIGFFIKLSILGMIMLVVGNLVHYQGRTLSDHAKNWIQNTEKSEVTQDIRKWAHQMSSPIEKHVQPIIEEVTPQDQSELKRVIGSKKRHR